MSDATDSSTLAAADPAGSPKRRRRLTPVSVGVLCLWAAVFLAGTAGGLYKWTTGYQRHVLGALNENVRYVEIEPEPGGPPVRLTSPRDIARLRGILTAAARRPESAGGLPPVAPADCAARVVYGDGTAEQFLIGRTTSRGPGETQTGRRTEVRWGAYVRYADGEAIGRLLGSPAP